MSTTGKIRVVMAKVGLDGHDRGVKVVARALRDAGMEVIYTGLHQTPQDIVRIAMQEDAQAIGISILSGAHNYLIRKVLEVLKEQNMDDVKVFAGGIIPDNDAKGLIEDGVIGVFGPGTPLDDIAQFIREHVRNKNE
ncbi:MAG: cobalamin B12-binding domain-containing protein [Candidatus Heimdallarchaeota archaeon]|nr:cobalamin B12-binding domain-containing protein [Candidatus Heimdallarchaeota archaeon]